MEVTKVYRDVSEILIDPTEDDVLINHASGLDKIRTPLFGIEVKGLPIKKLYFGPDKDITIDFIPALPATCKMEKYGQGELLECK